MPDRRTHFCVFQHTFVCSNTLLCVPTHFCVFQHTFVYCNTLLCIVTHFCVIEYTKVYCNKLLYHTTSLSQRPIVPLCMDTAVIPSPPTLVMAMNYLIMEDGHFWHWPNWNESCLKKRKSIFSLLKHMTSWMLKMIFMNDCLRYFSRSLARNFCHELTRLAGAKSTGCAAAADELS